MFCNLCGKLNSFGLVHNNLDRVMVRYRYRLKFNNVFFLNNDKNDLVAELQCSNTQSVVRKIRQAKKNESKS